MAQSTIQSTDNIVNDSLPAINEMFGDAYAHAASMANPHGVTKTQVGLGNCDNTSDAAKPISAATQAALNAITVLLASDETDLDTIQEIVDYIQTNRDDLDALGIANITGLQAALDAKQATLVSGTSIKTINGSSILGSGNVVIASGTNGTDGTDGDDGEDGVGVPVGGTTGQLLAKINNTDFNTEWVDAPSGGGGYTNENAQDAVGSIMSASFAYSDATPSIALATAVLDSLTLADSSVQPDDIVDFETTAQLNARDTANRARGNHTGTQAATTITGLATVATSGSYSDLTGAPDLSALNDVGVYANLAAFPATGNTDFVYIASDTGYMFRWNGSSYTQLTDQTAIWGQISGTISNQTDYVSDQSTRSTADRNADNHTNGTTNKVFTATNQTKLAGIETSATADQTAAEILTAVKTVDGASSGLDADLLDGLEASAFAPAINNIAGDGTILQILALARSTYNAIDPKVPTTLYLINLEDV